MVEVSVVMPCLDEEKTVGICVEKAIKVFKENNIDGEVIVADNGSTDNSVEIAKKAGARVVFEKRKGYGSAYLKGLNEAKGEYIVIADSDNTYDFLEIPKFLKLL
ncbi:MAG: glycosyltransferase family 2 protein, partial [Candidatus Altiarchaeum hamiconexum]|nr:glycosyltransferase family 2 protein [Candidatus Altarchaeum hamiconexum]